MNKIKTYEKILKFIVDYITFHGYSPSVREICDGVSIHSSSNVHYHLKNMLESGMIETDANSGTPRAIRVPGYKFVKEEAYKNL